MGVRYLIFFAFLLFTLDKCENELIKEENNFLILNKVNFEEAIKKFENLLVYFYFNSDRYCNSIFRNFGQGLEEFKKNKIYLAKVDYSIEKELIEKYKIKKYPAIKYFNKGKHFDYKNDLGWNQIIDWVKKINGQIVSDLKTIKDIQIFKSPREFSIIYYGKDKKEIEEFTKAAKILENFSFGIVEFDEGIKEYSKPNTIKLYKSFMNEEKELTTIEAEEIVKFIKENTKPKLMKFDGRASYITFSRGKPGLVLMESEMSGNWKKYENLLTKIMEKVGDKLQVILTDIYEYESEKLAQTLNVKKRDLPSLKIMEVRRNKKYKFEGEINESNILKFIKDWEEGNLKPEYKSEREPKRNDGDVFAIVSTSYEREVINNDKDVMLLLYSSTNYLSTKYLKEKYEILGKKLKEKNPNLRIAKIDLGLNEVEVIRTERVPFLQFYPGNKKNLAPLNFDSSRSVEEIIDFIKKNAFHKIVYDEEKKDEKTGDL